MMWVMTRLSTVAVYIACNISCDARPIRCDAYPLPRDGVVGDYLTC